MNKKTIATCILLFLLALCLLKLWTIQISAPIKHSPEPQLRQPDPLRLQIATAISKLSECESGNNPHAINPNDGGTGLDSRGILQFQRPTFAGYWRDLVDPAASASDIDRLWPVPENQIRLAQLMLEADFDNVRHWRNCARSAGLL